MKMGQFVCLGNLQHLRHRFGNGYAVTIKVASNDIDAVKNDLVASLPGLEIQGRISILFSLIF